MQNPLRKLSLLLLPSLLALVALNVDLTSVPWCQSKNLLLYSSSTDLPALQTTDFALSFDSRFVNTPMVAVGNAGYSSLDAMFNERWSISHRVNEGLTGLVLGVRVEANTRTHILYVGYLAVDQTQLPLQVVHIYQINFQGAQLAAVSLGSGFRSTTLTAQLDGTRSFPASSFVGCAMNAMHMGTSGSLGLRVDCSMLVAPGSNSTSTARVQVKVFDDLRLEKLGLSLIVVNKDAISGDNFYRVYAGSLFYTAAPSIVTNLNAEYSSSGLASFPVAHIASSNYIMTFAGWNSSNPATIVSFRWAQILDADTISFRLFKNNGINSVQFRFLALGRVQCIYWSVALQACVAGCSTSQTNGTDSICRDCQSPCRSCSVAVTRCTSCVDGYRLVASRCEQIVVVVEVEDRTYLLSLLAIVPSALTIAGFVYYQRKSEQRIMAADEAPSFREFPAIQI